MTLKHILFFPYYLWKERQEEKELFRKALGELKEYKEDLEYIHGKKEVKKLLVL